MTILYAIAAAALVIIVAAVCFAMGLYMGLKMLANPYKPDPLPAPEPNEEQKRRAESYQRDLNAIMTYTGSEK